MDCLATLVIPILVNNISRNISVLPTSTDNIILVVLLVYFSRSVLDMHAMIRQHGSIVSHPVCGATHSVRVCAIFVTRWPKFTGFDGFIIYICIGLIIL